MTPHFAIAASVELTSLSGPASRLRAKLRRIGARLLIALGFLAELAWAFFGSIGLRLGARPVVASDTTARLWFVGAVVLAILAGLAAWLANPERQRLDGRHRAS